MDACSQAIYEELRRVAKSGCYTHYSTIAPMANLDMNSPADVNRLGEILDEICLAEHEAGRPLLSAVVIRMDKNMPGDGFFNLSKELGLYVGNDDLMYWIKELQNVHKYWSS